MGSSGTFWNPRPWGPLEPSGTLEQGALWNHSGTQEREALRNPLELKNVEPSGTPRDFLEPSETRCPGVPSNPLESSTTTNPLEPETLEHFRAMWNRGGRISLEP